MEGFKGDIEKLTCENQHYRRVIFTTKEQQLVLMRLRPREEIGLERHPRTSQFLRIEEGTGSAVIGKRRYRLQPGSALLVPASIWHNVVAGREGLALYTIYSPPHHPKGTRQLRKE